VIITGLMAYNLFRGGGGGGRRKNIIVENLIKRINFSEDNKSSKWDIVQNLKFMMKIWI
jgi:hypothetical protein